MRIQLSPPKSVGSFYKADEHWADCFVQSKLSQAVRSCSSLSEQMRFRSHPVWSWYTLGPHYLEWERLVQDKALRTNYIRKEKRKGGGGREISVLFSSEACYTKQITRRNDNLDDKKMTDADNCCNIIATHKWLINTYFRANCPASPS